MGKLCTLHKKEHSGKTCDLHKARVDEGKSPQDKIKSRGERHLRSHWDEAPKSVKSGQKIQGYPHQQAVSSKEGFVGSTERGINTPWNLDNPKEKGPSSAGSQAEFNPETAKKIHGKVLNQMRSMPKPKLDKSQEDKLCKMHKSGHVCNLHKAEEQSSTPSTDDCPMCQDHYNSQPEHDCPMCQDLDAVENANGTAGMEDDDCPYCEEQSNEEGIDEDKCPYCDDEALEQADPQPVDDAQGIHPDNCPECQELYSDASENTPEQTGQEDPNLQGHETAEEVLEALDQEPGGPASQEAEQIDNTEMPQGDAMDDNTSVKENFGQAQANDVSDADKQFQQQTNEPGQDDQDDSPNMKDVLQGGLDEHAQDQKKQQVVDMVAQTLQGFKANKQSLEATREQNQPLYNSCIQMLKSMIALCDLLGLKPTMPAESGQESGQSVQTPPAQNSAPPQPNPGEGKPDPKAQGQV